MNNPRFRSLRHAELVMAIEDYSRAVGFSPRTICRMVINNSVFIINLRNGGDCTIGTEQKLRDYMAAHPPMEKAG